MEIKEQDSANIGGSHQCNFILLSRQERVKGLDDISGQESAESSSSTEKKQN